MFRFGVEVCEKHVLRGVDGDGLKSHLACTIPLDIDLFHGTSFRVEPPRKGLAQSELIERKRTISQGLTTLARNFSSDDARASSLRRRSSFQELGRD
jgi:hypothetical protein